jgi:hypothetical protein
LIGLFELCSLVLLLLILGIVCGVGVFSPLQVLDIYRVPVPPSFSLLKSQYLFGMVHNLPALSGERFSL